MIGLLVRVHGAAALATVAAGQSLFSVIMAGLTTTDGSESILVLCPASLRGEVASAAPSLPATRLLSDPIATDSAASDACLSIWRWDGVTLPATSGLTGPMPLAVDTPGRVVTKPWGREVWWAETPAYLGKLIEVRQGHTLSLQYHRKKLETLWVVSGRGRFQIGETELAVAAGYSVTLTPGTVHRISALEDLQVIEVSSPEADDVVRLDDRYGRR